MTAHQIELVKGKNTRRYDNKNDRWIGESFSRGERIIMVDGLRWGRTYVTGHGCHGTTHAIAEGMSIIEARPGTRYPGEESVRSMNQRHERMRAIGSDRESGWRPTEELVLEKVSALIAAGRLRHPDTVKAENDKAEQEYRAERIAAEQKRIEAFRQRAMEALQINDPTSDIIDRVVAAMEWAQSR